MKKLHDRAVFELIKLEEMTQLERKRALESLIFLVEKRDGRVSAQTYAKGSTQDEYITQEEAASPMEVTEVILITGVNEAKHLGDIMTLDIPNAFVQTPIPQDGDKVIMKIKEPLVNILCEICPGVYDNVVIK